MNLIGLLSLPALLVTIGLMFAYAARRPRPETEPPEIDGTEESDDPVIRGFIGLVRWLLILAVFGGTFGFLLWKAL